MATLQKIRKQSVFLLIVVGLAMLAFILGDALTSGNSLFQQSQENIVHINGKKLNYKEYERRIQELEDVYKMQSGVSSLDENTTSQIREAVYETIVRETLLDEQALALGVRVTEKEMFDMVNGENVNYMVQQMPFFQNPQTGAFDRNVMMNFLRTIQSDDLSMYSADTQAQILQMKNFWLYWENILYYNRLEEKLNTLLGKAVAANTVDARAAFDMRQRSVNFAYAFKSYASMPDSAYKVSDSEVKALYKQRREMYRQEPYRSVRYVVVDVLPSPEDDAAIKANIDSYVEDFSANESAVAMVNAHSDVPFMDCFVANTAFDAGARQDFARTAAVGAVQGPLQEGNAWIMLRKLEEKTRPDSVRISQIFVRNNGAEGQHLVDSLMDVLKKQRNADFAALALQFSEDQTAANGGDMGWFREMDAINGMGKDFVEACFNAKKGQYYSVKSKYGQHIITLTDATKPVKKSKVAALVMNVTPSSRTFSQMYNRLNQVIAKNQTAEAFVEAARNEGYLVQSQSMVRPTDFTLGNVPSMRQAVRFVFNNKVGDVSQIYENSNNQYMVVAITSASDGEYTAYAEVRDALAREVMNRHKAADMVKGVDTQLPLAELAQNASMRLDTVNLLTFSARRITGIGDEPAVMAAAMTAAKGELTAPIAGKNGVYVLEVLSDVIPGNEFDALGEKQAIDANESYRAMYQAYQAVLNAADIEDNRIRFY